MSFFLLKLGLLLFWCLWFSMVLLTNLIEGLQIVGALPKRWKLASNNYELIGKASSIYHAPTWLNQLLFTGVIVWQAVSAILFWRSLYLAWSANNLNLPALTLAFAFGLGLFAAFMLSDELFHYYQGERSHLEIFTGLLVTLIILVVVS
jgi:hypothetical protein